MAMLLALLVAILGAQIGAASLRIVVVAGEDAVNIIQQKTAVAPIVEVRDRNDQPVAGALVTFAINGGKGASFGGGLQTLAVTTNAAGRAVAAGLNPLASGAVQINVQAAFQGQLAATAIAQTNVMTAAEAAAIGAGSGGSSGAASGTTASASGGGGGLSGGAIAGIAGAAVGGAVVAVAATKDNGGGGTSPSVRTYVGPLNFQTVVTTVTSSTPVATTCDSTRATAGTLTISLRQESGTTSGSLQTAGTRSEVSVTTSQFCSPLATPNVPFSMAGPLTVALPNLSTNVQNSSTGTGITSTNTLEFSGALNGDVISGTLTYRETQTGVGFFNTPVNGNGSSTVAVTLTRQ